LGEPGRMALRSVIELVAERFADQWTWMENEAR
jgi:hypothetical protein